MLENKVIIVSGGAGRLGFAFAEEVLKNGANVIIGDITEGHIEKLIKRYGNNRVGFFCADLTISNNLERLISFCLEKYKVVDAAINCSYPKSNQWGIAFEKLQSDLLKDDLYNHLGGAILFSQHFISLFRKQGFGNLIHISSIQGVSSPKFEHYEGTKMVSPIEYTVIKSGLISMVKYLAKLCKNQNIRVNSISPGGILNRQPAKFIQRYNKSCLTKGMLDPEDITGTLLFLLSDKSKYINGQNIVVDDGWVL